MTIDAHEAETPNLFRSLFSWRPRAAIKPGENFLTEAVVYMLRRNEEFQARFIRLVTGSDQVASKVSINTRAAYRGDKGSTIYPDMEIKGVWDEASSFVIFVENKWWARFDPNQIKAYAKLLSGQPHGHLAFICARASDFREASNVQLGDAGPAIVPVLWENVYCALRASSESSGLEAELLAFMQDHNLGPGAPIRPGMIEAYLAGRSLPDRLHRYAEVLLRDYEWTRIPQRQRNPDRLRVRLAYGRLAIEFAPPSWSGAITIGFLLDAFDHKVPFENGGKTGLDLMLRLEASPALGPLREPALTVLKSKAPAVRAAGGVARLLDDPENGNKHTLLIAQRSLTHVVKDRGSENEQIAAIYAQADAWLQALFDDGTLAPTLPGLARTSPPSEKANVISLQT
ncbi:hypothetical protein [Methylorubrum extorquens]